MNQTVAIPAPAALFQMVGGLIQSRMLWAIAHLSVADTFEESATIDEIAAATDTHAPMLARVLDAACSVGIFARDDAGHYHQTDLSRALRSDHPASMRVVIDSIFGGVHYDAWGAIVEGLRAGKTPFDLHFGTHSFDYYGRHPEIAEDFSKAMSASTRVMESALLAAYDFGDFELAVDVGGSRGTLIGAVLARHPDARGILFDRPEVIDAVSAELEGTRITGVGGSFFESVPAGGDLYLLKFILHDWSDADCDRILAKVREAIRPGGRLCIADAVMPERPEGPDPRYMMDLNMLAITGGRERSASEFHALLGRNGFEIRQIVPTESNLSLIEAVAV
jgi:hypothetical protein